MNLHGFILSAGLVLAVCTSPGATPSLASGMTSPICQSAGINSGDDFVQKQTHIMAFDPPNNPNQRLILTGSTASGTRFADDLSKAFDTAPQSFQGQLCGLDGVLINTMGCATQNDCRGVDPRDNSWALRESYKRNPQKGGRYISLSAALWSMATHTWSYHQFETLVISGLLQGLDWPATDGNGPRYPSTGSDPTDTPAMTILAAMAHEVGHLLWYDFFNPKRYDPKDPRYTDPNTFCSAIGGFFGRSWITPVTVPPRWRYFGEGSQDQHLSPPEIKDIRAAILHRGDNTASALVDQIYDISQPWASLFAAFSADEDFVETFKLKVLLNANPPLQSLPIQFPYQGGKTEDVPGTLAQRIELTNKLSCFPVVP